MSEQQRADEDVVVVLEPEDLVEAVLEAQQEREARERVEAEARESEKIFGVVIGRVDALTSTGPVVRYRGCPGPDGLVARCATQVTEEHVGRRAALMFEGGDPAKPILTGMLHFDDDEIGDHPAMGSLQIEEDDQKIDITLKKAISLKCGKASLIITPNGKILLRGKYLLSRASGVNRVQGGSVRIN